MCVLQYFHEHTQDRPSHENSDPYEGKKQWHLNVHGWQQHLLEMDERSTWIEIVHIVQPEENTLIVSSLSLSVLNSISTRWTERPSRAFSSYRPSSPDSQHQGDRQWSDGSARCFEVIQNIFSNCDWETISKPVGGQGTFCHDEGRRSDNYVVCGELILG